MYIIDNPTIKDFGYFTDSSRAKALHLDDVVMRYLGTRKVVYLSFWLNFKLNGLDPRGYHAINISVHAINAALLYIIVILVFRTPVLEGSGLAAYAALFSALLFATHPVQTEAVTYITQRFVSISAMFYLASLLAYLRWRLNGSWIYIFLSAASAVLAMKSKEIAFTLPVMVGLMEFMFFRGGRLRRALFILPHITAALIIPFNYLMEHGGLAEATRLQTDMPRLQYLFTQTRIVLSYLRVLLLPVNQSVDHAPRVYGSLLSTPVIASATMFVGIIAASVVLVVKGKRPEYRVVCFGVLWFFIALSIESSVVPISELMFEYRLYLPSVGLITAIVSAIFLIGRGVLPRTAVALSILVITFSVFTYQRNGIWQNEVSLWEDAVRKSPGKSRGHYGLGVAYGKLGMYHEAIRELRETLRIKPDFADAMSSLGLAHERLGDHVEAQKLLKAALELDPELMEARVNLGLVYQNMGMHEEAASEYNAVLGHEPHNTEANNGLGVLYARLGRYEEAGMYFKMALRSRPGYVDALNNLGFVYESTGRHEEAVPLYRKALEADPENEATRQNLKSALERT